MIELKRGLVTLGLLVGLVANAHGEPPHGQGPGEHPGRPGDAKGKGPDIKSVKGLPPDAKAPDGAHGKGPHGEDGSPQGRNARGQDPASADGEPGRRSHGELRRIRDELKAGTLKKADLEERLRKLRDSNKERRDAHRAAIKARWGEQLAKPDAQNELAVHQRRLAKLDRLLLLSQSERSGQASDKLAERIEKLIELETARHEKRMAQIASGTATPAPTPSTAVNTEVTK
jgi:hypothetical protein